jgi:valyl-tRNA synthetase
MSQDRPDHPDLRVIDPDKIGKHFEIDATEARWAERWQRDGVYAIDPEAPREKSFVVDTPPPTVSGALHIGHVFSFTQTDVVARYKRMAGFNVVYPLGWDDNGLPTERRVQNLYHVRCDPPTPYEPGLVLEPASAKERKGRPRLVSRLNFIEICERQTVIDEQAYKELFSRLGLSVDWSLEYSTINEHCRRVAQLSFRDLFEKGHVYTNFAPTMWDVDFQTAVAQAEAEDRDVPGAYHKIEFGVEGSESNFVIATTRPELLPACVGVTAHPDDDRYKDLFGKHAVTPLFRVPVPIFPSELADPEKGTGILMVCTFGDATDVVWWREQQLDMRIIVGRNGRLEPMSFSVVGAEPREGHAPSLNPGAASGFYEQLAGKNIKQAKKAIVELLQDPVGSATGSSAPLKGEPETMQHPVRFYEKGDRPLEFIPTRQWFVRLLDKKQQLLDKGAAVSWHPPFMHTRFRDWTENLQLDWCVSRQRYFGVSIPVWYPIGANGEADHENPMVAEPDQLPVDAMADAPRGYEESQRDQPGGFTGERDIFDTWFTSSMTPQITSHWSDDPARHARMFPADIRPQSHEIIRTWAFYTIAKAMLHEDSLPWRSVLISGWILDPDRKKMSKSKGNVVTPLEPIDQFGADSVRYWAASARLGVDTALDEQVFKVGKRLVTKIYNAAKFVLSQQAEPHAISTELDRAFARKLKELAASTREAFDDFDHARALQETESFFWTHFTDTYLELVKPRARAHADGREGADAAKSGSAVATLRLGLNVLLRLLAPVLPYVTEEVWSWAFADETGHDSIHTAPWPSDDDFAAIAEPAEAASFDAAVACFSAINKAKADAEVSMGREALRLTISTNSSTRERLGPVLADVLAGSRCHSHKAQRDDQLADDQIEISDAEFAPKPPKK